MPPLLEMVSLTPFILGEYTVPLSIFHTQIQSSLQYEVSDIRGIVGVQGA